MTPKEQVAMQQALEFCEELTTLGGKYPYVNETEVVVDAYKTITAMREALAEQAEQEPVAWFVQYKNRHEFVFGSKPEFIVDGVVEPLYAAPVRTKDLTDAELHQIWRDIKSLVGLYSFQEIARAVIAAHKEKQRGTA